MHRLAVLAAALLAAGCTKTEVVTQEAAPLDLVGSVVGRVTSRATGAPLAGVAVTATLPSGDVVATTDAGGDYVLAGLPVGAAHTLRFRRPGLVPMARDVALPQAAGAPGQGNAMATLNLVMTTDDAALEGHVGAAAGPAEGATVVVDLRGSGYDLVARATVAADGGVRLAGLPDLGGASVAVAVLAWDADGDGTLDFRQLTDWVPLHAGVTTVRAWLLEPVSTAPGDSTCHLTSWDFSDGTHAADTPLRITADRVLDAGATWVKVTDRGPYRDVAVGWSADAEGSALLIAPVGGAPFAAGHDYAVEARAVAADGTTCTLYDTFVAGAGGTPPAPVSGLTVAPVPADWDTRAFTLRWAAVEGADRYEIWLRDTAFNPSFTRHDSVGSMPAPAYTLTLPAAYDYYTGDGLQTPLLWGTAVEIAVVPVGVAGATGGVAAATPLRVVDGSPPEVIGSAQAGTADNAAGAAAVPVELTLTFDEYLDPSSVPSITVPAGVTVVDAAVDPGLRLAVLRLEVAAGADGTGPITVSGLTDTSGNAMPAWTGRLGRRVELLVNGGFEAGSLAGWTTYYSGTASPPAWVASPVAAGGGAARLGAAGMVAQSGYSRISQDVAIPADATGVFLSARYRTATTATYGYDDLDCALYTTGGSLLASVVDVSVAPGGTWLSATKPVGAGAAGTTVRFQCQVYQWSSYASTAWLDALSLVVER